MQSIGLARLKMNGSACLVIDATDSHPLACFPSNAIQSSRGVAMILCRKAKMQMRAVKKTSYKSHDRA